MHIIIDATTTQDQLAYAGVGQYTKNIILSLIKNYPENQYSILLFRDKESTLRNMEQYYNVEIVDIGKHKVSDYKNDFWYYTKILPIIKKIRNKDSIYFCPYFWRNYPSFSMPTVLFIHDMILPLYKTYSQKASLHNYIRKLQYWFALNKSMKCKHILFNSETTKLDYLKYYPSFPEDRTSVSYLGVDLDEREFPIDKKLPKDYKERGYLLYMGGGISRNKNSIGVIQGYNEFLKLLNKENSPYLVIAGGKFTDKEAEEVKELNKYIKENNLEKQVIFYGFYEDKQKYSLLKSSFAFIHLSLYEGFGLAPIESLRSKTPTILHRNKVYKELFADVAIMVNGEDISDVGKGILDVYTNPEKYHNRIEKGYQLSKQYTWEKAASITNKAFEKITEEIK